MSNFSPIDRSHLPGSLFEERVVREIVLINKSEVAVRADIESVYPAIVEVGSEPRPLRISASCGQTNGIWMFSSVHKTQADGSVRIELNKFLDCAPGIYDRYIGSGPHFVATAQTQEPIFLTCKLDIQEIAPPSQQAFLPQALDITIEVMSWKHDGTSAPHVVFNWIAIAQVATVTNF